MPEYTRRWGLTSSEWESPDGGPSPLGVALFNAHLAAAQEYARALMEPRMLNWVRVDWIWY